MKTWDEGVATIDWPRLLAEGKAPYIPIEVITSKPIQRDYWDTLELIKFNMN